MLTKDEEEKFQALRDDLWKYAVDLDAVFPQSNGSELTFKAFGAINDLMLTIKFLEKGFPRLSGTEKRAAIDRGKLEWADACGGDIEEFVAEAVEDAILNKVKNVS